jgi:hypothetical protein
MLLWLKNDSLCNVSLDFKDRALSDRNPKHSSLTVLLWGCLLTFLLVPFRSFLNKFEAAVVGALDATRFRLGEANAIDPADAKQQPAVAKQKARAPPQPRARIARAASQGPMPPPTPHAIASADCVRPWKGIFSRINATVEP